MIGEEVLNQDAHFANTDPIWQHYWATEAIKPVIVTFKAFIFPPKASN